MTSDELLNYIAERNPIHGKKVAANFESMPNMEADFQTFLQMFRPYMDREAISGHDLGEAYLTMVEQMTAARLDFARTGRYSAESQQTAVSEVYSNPRVMTKYMLGLALSQFLWKHHYRLYVFYREYVRQIATPTHALEVGSGHGLFLLDLLAAHPTLPSVDVVDISDTSLRLTASLIAALKSEVMPRIRFVHADVAEFSPDDDYDFITMGEVLEHVHAPDLLLASMRRLLRPGGRMFVSTCANCPTIDHIYHFTTVEQIRAMIVDHGLAIMREVVVPSEDLTDEQLARYRLDVLYGAIVSRRE